jgi:hypothetical protein
MNLRYKNFTAGRLCEYNKAFGGGYNREEEGD